MVALSDLGYQVVLHDAFEWCYPLEMAPDGREPELNSGDWLVLLFAVWSGPDLDCIRAVLDAAGLIGRSVSVGIRPYDDSSEARTWIPEVQELRGSPIWVLIRDGAIRWIDVGRLTVDEIVGMVKNRLAP